MDVGGKFSEVQMKPKTIRDILWDLTQGKHDKRSGLRLQVYTLDEALAKIEAIRIRELPSEKKLSHREEDGECGCRYLDEDVPCVIRGNGFNDCRSQAIKQIKEGPK